MRIRFNNFFKFKNKDKRLKGNNKSNKPIDVKEHVLKVYSGGQIIKYEPHKMSNKSRVNISRRRKGAENIGRTFDSGGSDRVELNKKIIKKYKDEYINESEYSKKNDESVGNKQKKSAYLLFSFMVVLAVYSLYFSYGKYKDLSQEDYAVYNSEDIEISEVMPEEQSSISNNLDTIKKEEVVKTTTSTTSNTAKVQVQKVKPLSFAKPLEGEILKIYSKDKVIYSKTLELWKTHDGIDIKADENTIVKAIEKGTIEKIYDDSFYGKTIVIDHGQGYKSSYSNLGEEVFVKEKQVVTKLAKIGKVGKTSIGEIKDEPHLHFVLIKNNEICDPSSIFK